MSERYSRVFSLPEKLYAEGSPVIIGAGALLKDNQTGKVLVQLKLKSLSRKSIKAATVVIETFDTAGKPLGEEITHQYLDLEVTRDGEFGQKEPIALPDAVTRSFTVAVSQVVFQDNSTWEDKGGTWEPLPPLVRLAKALGDDELVKQYRLKFGAECSYTYQEVKDLWYCPCGEINRKGEACVHCQKSGDPFAKADTKELTAERDARLAQEKQEAAQRAEQQREEEAQRKAAAKAKAAKTKKIVAVVAAVAILCAAGVLLATKFIKYNHAVSLRNEEEFEQAITVFKELGDFKDSSKQLDLCYYQEGYRHLCDGLSSAGAYFDKIKDTEAFSDLNELKSLGFTVLELNMYSHSRLKSQSAITRFNTSFADYKEKIKSLNIDIKLNSDINSIQKNIEYYGAYVGVYHSVEFFSNYEAAITARGLEFGYPDADDRNIAVFANGEMVAEDSTDRYTILSDGTIMQEFHKSSVVDPWTWTKISE